MNNSKKDLIIIIPGIKYLKSHSNLGQGVIGTLYNLTHVFHPVYFDYAKNWKRELLNKGHKSIILTWERKIDPISRYLAIRKLKKKIYQKSKKYNVTLIGISAGGEIILETLKEKNIEPRLKKAILLASLNETTNIESKVPIINIYSPYDLFLKIAIKTFAPIHGGLKLVGKNIKNIKLPKITHDEFCSAKKIKQGKYKNKTIVQLVNSFI